tara:strand:- start:735 stop:1301 length:567 start_codon:yes stop_codon:yes gene_type:complete
MKSIVVDDFFEDITEVYNHVKSIKTYDCENYPKDSDTDTFISNGKAYEAKIDWPGYRSDQLAGKDDWLLEKFSQGFKKHFTGLIRGQFNLHMFSHLRLEKDNETDFIHKDLPHTYSMLIYLSPTNLNSGTDLYNENKEMVNSFKFVQNRAIIFNSGYYHKAINNHGNDLDDGRLTLNIFMDVPEMSQQ